MDAGDSWRTSPPQNCLARFLWMIYGAFLTVAVAVTVTPVGMGAKAHQPRKEASVYGVIHMKDQL
jgi:hypothetical protein